MLLGAMNAPLEFAKLGKEIKRSIGCMSKDALTTFTATSNRFFFTVHAHAVSIREHATQSMK